MATLPLVDDAALMRMPCAKLHTSSGCGIEALKSILETVRKLVG